MNLYIPDWLLWTSGILLALILIWNWRTIWMVIQWVWWVIAGGRVQ